MTKFALLAVGVVLLILGYRAAFGVPAHLKYRITIELDTPEGVRSGTAVQELAVTTPSSGMMPIWSGSSKNWGDALVIRVGSVDYFVPRITCAALAQTAIRIGDVVPISAKNAGDNVETIRVFARTGKSAVMSGAHYMSMPYRYLQILKFTDAADWRTRRIVDVTANDDGLSLRSVSVESSSDPITRQAVERLPWLKTLREDQIKLAPDKDGRVLFYMEGLSDLFRRK